MNAPFGNKASPATAGLWAAGLLLVLFANVFPLRGLAAEPEPRPTQLEAMAGAMIMAVFQEDALQEGDPFLEAVRAGVIGHVLLSDKDMPPDSSNDIASPERIRALAADLKAAALGPLFIAVTQEGGEVARHLKTEHDFIDMPAVRTLGRGKPENTAILARRLGSELANLGISVNLAPVADLDTHPHSLAGGTPHRSFSADPAVVSRHALAFGLGLHQAGIIPVLKHFPGSGGSQAGPGKSPADITAHWISQADLKPYVDAIRTGWPGMIMVGHLIHARLDPVYPATLSKYIVHDLLRTTLNWEGVVISDDMGALTARYSLDEAVRLAVNAGVDILLFADTATDPELPAKAHAALVRLVREKHIPVGRIQESWQRISRLYQIYTQTY